MKHFNPKKLLLVIVLCLATCVNFAQTTVFETTRTSVNYNITATASEPNRSLGVEIQLSNPQARLLDELEIDIRSLEQTNFQFTMSIYSDCPTLEGLGQSCGLGPGYLIYSQTESVSIPLNVKRTVTFSLPNVDLTSEADNEIYVMFTANQPGVCLYHNESIINGSAENSNRGYATLCGQTNINNTCSLDYPTETAILAMKINATNFQRPEAICQDVQQNLPSSGSLTLNASDFDGGSFDPDGNIDQYSIGRTQDLTYFNGNTIGRAIMFDITAVENFTLNSLDLRMTNTASDQEVAVFYKYGTYVGSETNAPVWRHIKTVTGVNSLGSGNYTPLDLNASIPVAAGQTLALFVVAPTNSGSTIRFGNGTSGNVIASNSVLQLKGGISRGNNFFSSGSSANFVFNGRIHYSQPTSSINFGVADVGSSSVWLNVRDNQGLRASCPATLTLLAPPTANCQDITVTAPATVTADDIDAGSTDINGTIVNKYIGYTGKVESAYTSIAGSKGIVFDILANENVRITSFDVNNALNSNLTTLNVYYKQGTHVGFEEDSSAWTFIKAINMSTSSSNNNGNGTPSPLNLGTAVPISAGQRAAFMLVYDNDFGGSGLAAPSGTSTNTVNISDSKITMYEGATLQAPFTLTTSNSIRKFQGAVYYMTDDGALTFDCSASGTYNVGLVVEDNEGYYGSCNSIITVNPSVPLSITCPSNIVMECNTTPVSYPATYNGCVPPTTLAGFTFLGVNQGKSFYVSDASLNGPNAYADAIANGGFVATIENAEQNSFIKNAINVIDPTLDVRIGYSDVATEGAFVWQDGSTATYTNWNGGEPNNAGSGEDYVEMRESGGWNDVNENYSIRYVLQLSGGFEQTAGLPSGSIFPYGTTTNTFVVTDSTGDTDTCSFNVIVEDSEAPVISCVPDATRDTDSGVCEYTVVGTEFDATFTDNCTSATITNDLNGTATLAGEVLPLGATSVVWTVDDGNGQTATCTTVITVEDNEAPVVTCVPDATRGTDPGVCEYTVVGTEFDATFTDNCTSATITNDLNGTATLAGEVLPLGATSVVWTVDDGSGQTATCTTVITIEDNEAPVITCVPDATRDTDPGVCEYTVVGTEFDATFTDNCTSATITNDLNGTATLAGEVLPLGATTVVWIVDDGNGQTAICTTVITVEDNEAPEITCPADITVSNDPGMCSADVTVPIPTITDNCTSGNSAQEDDIESYTLGSTFNQDPNWVTWSGAASEAGQFSNEQALSGTQSVKITGNASGGPVDQLYLLGNRTFGVWEVTYSMYIPNGNTAYTNLQKSETAGTEWGHEVQYASNGTGYYRVNNTLTAFDFPNDTWFEVKHIIDQYNDRTEFIVNNVSVKSHPFTYSSSNTAGLNQIGGLNLYPVTNSFGSEPNTSAVPLYYIDDISLRAVTVATNDYNLSTNASDTYPLGTTVVTWTVTDPSGNTASCTHNITVNDTEAPIVTCLADLTVSNDPGVCGAIVTYENPTATENCSEIVGFTTLGDLNGKMYYVSNSTFNGSGSYANAVANNGFVTTITDAAHNTFLVNALAAEGITQTVIIGFNDSAAEGTFVWHSGEAVTYTNWNGGEPNNSGGGEDYTVLGTNGRWNDIGNSTNRRYILEVALQATQIAGLPSGSEFPVGTTTNTFEYTDAAGNTGTCSFNVTVEDMEDPIAICQDITIQLDSSGEAMILPEDINGGSSDNCGVASLSIDMDTFDCSHVGLNNVTLTVTDGNGNTATCVAVVTVEDNIAPEITCPADIAVSTTSGDCFAEVTFADATALDACGIASVVQTMGLPSGSQFPVGTTTIEYTATDVNGNTAVCSFTITITDNEPPVANCVAPFTLQLDPNGIASITAADINNGSTDNCGIASLSVSPSSFTCADVGANIVTLTVTDVNGNVANCTTTVTVEDNVPPVAVCMDITIQLDATGNASIVAADIDGGSTDACGIASISASQTDFDCSHVGPNNVTLTITDANGNMATCTAMVTVEDNTPPVITCQDITIQLDENGAATITTSDVMGAITDNCGVASSSIDMDTFDCSHVGPNNVTLTVTDVNGNSATCVAVVTVEDNIVPVIACPADITANTTPGDCFAEVSFASAIALDNCEIASVVQTAGLPSGSQFPVGVSTIEYTATDVNGNTATCSFTITVTDNESPMAVCQDITIALDATGNATIVAADIDGGSSDNCGIASISASQTAFDCSHVGDNNVILTVTDVNGNVSTCTAIVTVEDVTAPVVACMDITVELDVNGTVTILPGDIDNGSSDACGIAGYALDIDTFTCDDVGDNIVTLTVTDVNGNTNSCTATVTVEDNIMPVLVCMDITVELDQDGLATITPADVIDTMSDACGIATTAIDITDFDCSDIGTPVLVTVFTSDVNGNLNSCTATVTVVDLLGPVVTCPADQTVDPGAGNLFYTVPDYFATGEATATDNCTDPLTIFSQSPAAGSQIPDGVYTVSVCATDEYGNETCCTFELTVESLLGNNEITVDFGSISMYPNPARDYVMLSNPQSLGLDNVAIYDVTGRLIRTIALEGMGTEKQIDLYDLASATYLFVISGDNGMATKQIIKE